MANDDHLLSTTKARLANLHLRSENSLKTQLCKFVARNISFYINPASRMYLGQLPSILRNEILTELTKFALHPNASLPAHKRPKSITELQVIKEAFKFLLSNDTHNVDLTWLSFAPARSRVQFVQEVLHLVSSLAPNVRVLTLQNKYTPECVDFPFRHAGSILHASCIGRLNHLHTLELQHLSIKYQQLLDLGTRLPSLQILNINIIYFVEHFEVDMEALRRSLPNLKQFLFRSVVVTNDQLHDYSGSDCSRNFAILCIQHLPGLEAVGSWNSPPDRFSLEPEELVELSSPCRLRHLVVRNSGHSESNLLHLLYPDLTHLELINPFYFFEELTWIDEDACDPYLLFPKLVSLRVVHPPPEMFSRFSHTHKLNLHTLEVVGMWEVYFSFESLFACFPNLRELSLTDMYIGGGPIDPQLLSLRKLHLSSNSGIQCVLRNILAAAPHLQEVKLQNVELDARELQHLTQLVASHQIFNELHSFLLQVEKNFCNLNGYCQLVKTICAHSPKLVELALYVEYNGVLNLSQEQIFQDLGESNMLHFLAAFKAY